MSDLWLGASKEEARYVFLLPNEPVLSVQNNSVLSFQVSVDELIELNGNHWRKILTIMAKLTSPEYGDWREFRDKALLQKVGVAFSRDQLTNYKGVLFVVGNTFREAWPIPEMAQKIGDKHVAAFYLNRIWCPYLDYRQFPNILIEAVREAILE